MKATNRANLPFLPIAASTLLLPAFAVAQEPQAAPTGTTIVIPGVERLKIGGEYRIRYEGLFDYDFDHSAASAASNDYFTQRVRLDFDLDFGEKVDGFIQIQDAREWGEEASTIDDAADGLDLHQGYVDLHEVLGGTARIGRQEINLGDQRLVGALDWKSQARALDGVHQSWTCDKGCSTHVWFVQARELINTINDDARFVGIQHSPVFGEGWTNDFYLMYLQDDGTTVGGTQNRFTLGTRAIWKADKSLEFGLEAATQFGDLAGNDIKIGKTYAAHVHGQYMFEGDMHPKLTLACDVASGDDPSTADVERFNNLFPTAHAHWGMMDLALWENLFNPWLRFALEPNEVSTLSATVLHFAAMEASDAFGGPNGQLSPGNAAFSKDMGNEIDLLYTRRLDLAKNVKTAVQVGYGLFLPGDGVKDAKGTDDMAHFLYAQFDLRF